jgi:Bacterial Ig-like domain (group 3)
MNGPTLAATDFHAGFVQTFLPRNPGFTPVVLADVFTDANLPPGYAPFGIQVIGSQVFVTYALQDALKHDPVVGAGNGIVNIFDMAGNFVKRFATGGTLNAPWGITQASANFGPFSNDILIGNVGEGSIGAFDPASGRFLGPLLDGNGLAIAAIGLNALAFRADGFADPDTLYFTSQVNTADNGIFGAITPGLVSALRLSGPDTAIDTHVTITANVSAGAGNTGDPTGLVTFLDGTTPFGIAPLSNGSAAVGASFDGPGVHAITALYSGDRVFLPVSESTSLQVTGFATTLTLGAPASAAPGLAVALTANINSPSGVPTGQIVFLDGNTGLGTSPLDGTGAATLRINTLAAGTHTLRASYDGDGKFGASTSAGVVLDIADPDFSISAAPPRASVVAGQSTQFMLTVTSASGFANTVVFSCPPVTGITCSFSPATVTPANGSASTRLTVTTSATISRYGILKPDTIGPWALLFALGLCSLAMWTRGKVRALLPSPMTATAAITIAAMGLAIVGCGYGSSTQANRGTATVIVNAQSGAISHTTSVSVTVQ